MNHQNEREINPIFICFGPYLGSKDDGDRVEMGRQGRNGCPFFGV